MENKINPNLGYNFSSNWCHVYTNAKQQDFNEKLILFYEMSYKSWHGNLICRSEFHLIHMYKDLFTPVTKRDSDIMESEILFIYVYKQLHSVNARKNLGMYEISCIYLYS